MSAVTLTNVTKRYGALQVIHGIDLDIAAGEFVTFVGPDGSGKLMVLRMVAGLEPVTGGRITLGGRDVAESGPGGYGVAMAMRASDLHPRRSVAEALASDLAGAGRTAAEVRRCVARAARHLRLEPLLDRRPPDLSAAERVRVCIGQALAREPEILVCDDPLATLEAEVRAELRLEIGRLQAALGVTMLYATEDRAEAMAFADRIVVLRQGRIEQVGAPLDLYRDPDTRFAAGFVGTPAMNFLSAVAVDGRLDVPALGRPIEVTQRLRCDGMKVALGLRPEHVTLAAGHAFEVELSETLGAVSYAHLRATTGETLVAEERGETRARRGERVDLHVDPARVTLFDAETGLRMR